MQNVNINTCEKFHYDRLRNDRALGNGKSGNNNNKKNNNNVRSHWGPVSGSTNEDISGLHEFASLCAKADNELFTKILNSPNHVLHPLLCSMCSRNIILE